MQRQQLLKRELQRMLPRIIKHYQPEKVILFGSLASGRIHAASDIDLLIVKSTKHNKLQRIAEIQRIANPEVAFEPMILTPEELRFRLRWGDAFIQEVLKQGKVLYEK